MSTLLCFQILSNARVPGVARLTGKGCKPHGFWILARGCSLARYITEPCTCMCSPRELCSLHRSQGNGPLKDPTCPCMQDYWASCAIAMNSGNSTAYQRRACAREAYGFFAGAASDWQDAIRAACDAYPHYAMLEEVCDAPPTCSKARLGHCKGLLHRMLIEPHVTSLRPELPMLTM